MLAAVMTHFPVLGDEPVPLDLSVPDPVLDEPALLTVDEVADTFLAGMLAAPIEEWMAFLHPDQAKLVRRSFSGPARIRGAAGTGKTVVGLHRAASLSNVTRRRAPSRSACSPRNLRNSAGSHRSQRRGNCSCKSGRASALKRESSKSPVRQSLDQERR